MLSRLRASSTLHRIALGLALLLPLSLNAAAGNACADHAWLGMPDTAMPHADMPMPAHAGHADMDGGQGDCADPVCQTACASTTAIAVTEAAPAPQTHHARIWQAPDTTPRAGHPHRLLRPPLFS